MSSAVTDSSSVDPPAAKKRKLPSSVSSPSSTAMANNGSTSREFKTEIDESLYSRQLYVLGHDAMHRMASSDILISGIGGLGVEIAKNVILAGVRSVILHDNVLATIEDLSSQFYVTEEDVGKNRAEVSCPKLSELNNYVHTSTYTGNLTEEFIKKFKVVVLTNTTNAEQLRISKITHENNIALIVADTKGLFGKIFCDFGDNFLVYDKNGANVTSTMIAGITREENGIVTCLDETRHGFEDDEYVTFSEVQGMVELNDCAPIKITVLGPYTFSIGDTTKFGAYIRGGIVTSVKMPVIMTFKSLLDANADPQIVMTDYSKDYADQLHTAFNALDEFKVKYGREPTPWNNEDVMLFLEIAKTLLVKAAEFNEKLLTIFCKICTGDLAPINAVIGGIVGQEVMKACSGKFTPINQYLYYDALECLQESDLEKSEWEPIGSRYDKQTVIFGRTFQNVLADLKYFIVGAGAIGCEYLKNFAMLGIAVGNGKIHITDMDLVEKSNLNRQFLFRPEDVQKSKSRQAAVAVSKMNPGIQVVSYIDRVGPETESVFDDIFFEQLDGVANALDNNDARIFMDRKCVYYRKSLIDGGTMGTLGNTQVVVPRLTESYGSSQDPPEKSIPICTLKNFPYAIEHTLQWARDYFEGAFKCAAENAAQYVSDPTYITKVLKLPGVQPLEILESIKVALVDRPHNFEDCVKWARHNWEDQFSSQIRQLLFNFPADQTTSSGQLFWSGPKRCPTPLRFSVDEPLHLDFIFSAANLKAQVYGIPQNRCRRSVCEIVSTIQVPEFVPKSGVKIAITDAALQAEQNGNDNFDQDRVQRIVDELSKLGKLDFKIVPLEFEKDDDKNFHMDFIVAASNARATNYQIKNADRHQSKLIAGKIIPAIATTTSVIAGFACIEMIKLAQRFDDLNRYKNTFINLALPIVQNTTPVPPVVNTFYDNNWTLWDRFDVQGELTLAEFMDYFKTQHKLEITMLSQGVSMLYSFFMPKSRRDERMVLPMSEIVKKVSKKKIEDHVKALVFEICCNNEDGEDVEVPYVRYIL